MPLHDFTTLATFLQIHPNIAIHGSQHIYIYPTSLLSLEKIRTDPNRTPLRLAVQVHLVVSETSGAQSAIGGLCSHGLPNCDLGSLGGLVQTGLNMWWIGRKHGQLSTSRLFLVGIRCVYIYIYIYMYVHKPFHWMEWSSQTLIGAWLDRVLLCWAANVYAYILWQSQSAMDTAAFTTLCSIQG